MNNVLLQGFLFGNYSTSGWLLLYPNKKKANPEYTLPIYNTITFYKKGILFLSVLLLIGLGNLMGQKENNIWYFGEGAGLDFNSGTAVPIYDSKMYTNEGCATVSDTTGKILFYTDGVKVWNKQHKVMDNGSGLLGHKSATQSAIIVKKPGSNTLYYIFNPGCKEIPNSFHYSVVDINANGENGKVIEKNTALLSQKTAEKVLAIRDASGTGYWIIVHLINSNEFYSFHLTKAGINPKPVISSTESYINSGTDFGEQGYLKASPNGSKLVSCSSGEKNMGASGLELFDFNNSTGVISNGITLYDASLMSWYGCSFSPNGKLLYASSIGTNNRSIYQFDVSLPTKEEIIASTISLITLPVNSMRYMGALQIAPDGKIYISCYGEKFLSAINKPNIKGMGCLFVEKAVTFTHTTTLAALGLPNHIDFLLQPDTLPSLGNDTFLCPPQNNGFIIRPYKLGDVEGDSENYRLTKWSNGTVGPNLTVYTSGIYWADIPTPNGFVRDSIKIIFYPDLTKYDFLGNDTLLCGKLPTYTATYAPHTHYKWSTGATTQTTTIPQSGTYWVDAETPCGKVRDSIKITLMDSIQTIDLGHDTVVCGNSITLKANNIPGAAYEWSTGEKTQDITLNTAGNYWVEVSNQCNRKKDFITVDFVQDQIDKIFIGNDTLLCTEDNLLLDPGYIPNAKYKWGTGDTTQTYRVDTTGKYTLEVTTYGCNTKLKDAIDVVIFKTKTPDLPRDSNWCEHNFKPLVLSPNADYTRFFWQDGSISPSYTVAFAGIYTLETIDTCGNEYKDTFRLAIEDCPCEMHVPNVFTPNNDGKNDIFNVYDYCQFKRFNLKIFNRWGQLIFETNDPNKGWDGNFADKPAPEGVYLVHVGYDIVNMPSWPDYSGTVTLLR